MLQLVLPLLRQRLRGSASLLLPLSFLSLLPGSVVAAPPTSTNPLTNNPHLDTKVVIHVKGIPLRELLALIARKTGVSLQADTSVADEKVVIFSPARPLKEVMADMAAVFNNTWMHRQSENGSHTYRLVRSVKAKEYEDGLDTSAFTQLSAQLDALVHALGETPEQVEKRPASDVLRHALSEPECRLAALIYAGITPEQRTQLFQEAKIHLPFSALAPAQQEEVQRHWLTFLDAEEQRKAEMPESPRVDFKPNEVQRKGVTLSLFNRSGSFSVEVHPIGASLKFRSELQWQLPAHGNPYTRKRVPQNISLPETKQVRLAMQERTWLDRLHKLSETSGRTVIADYYRARTIVRPNPEAESADLEQREEKQREEIASLDKMCQSDGYLWWASNTTLFFRKRDWYTQMRYEIPDSWLLALTARLKAQKNHLTYTDVFNLLALSPRQLVGLNSLRFKNEPVGTHFLGESHEAELAGLHELLALAKTACPHPDKWLLKTSEVDRTEVFWHLQGLTPQQSGLLSAFLEKQATSLEYLPGDDCFLNILSGDAKQLSRTPSEGDWMLIEIQLETQTGRKLSKPGAPQRNYLMLMSLPTSLPDDHRNKTKVEVLP